MENLYLPSPPPPPPQIKDGKMARFDFCAASSGGGGGGGGGGLLFYFILSKIVVKNCVSLLTAVNALSLKV